jgi:hypothetical protein
MQSFAVSKQIHVNYLYLPQHNVRYQYLYCSVTGTVLC